MKNGNVALVCVLVVLVVSVIGSAIFVFKKRTWEKQERYEAVSQAYDWDSLRFLSLPTFPTVFPYEQAVLPKVHTDFFVVRKDAHGEAEVYRGPEGKKLTAERTFMQSDFALDFLPRAVHDFSQKHDELKEKEKKKEKEAKTNEQIYGSFVKDVHYADVIISTEHLPIILLLEPMITFKVDLTKSKANDVVLFNYALGRDAVMYRVKDLPKCVVAYLAVSPDGTRFSDRLWIAYDEQCTQKEADASLLNHIVIRKAKLDPYKQQL